eukprot:TRINITY_DN16494_c0_g1_i1.p1 TRINITY_DN16494_c0_g1~~TRINITY_DN16494_c0_g1_i1.p1  ORF type:complete len:624 (+),score=252.16 TRINITY_DN16494_c0_g1_i1:65-1936(+)
MKIIDKIHDCLERDSFFYSFEFFPPKTDAGLVNLLDRMERMAELKPTFVGATWGMEAKTMNETLEICATAQNLMGMESLMHITCTNTPFEVLKASLRSAREAGIQNLLVLRGAKARPDSHFQQASEFLAWIKKEHGDYFGIGVAGYPEGHEEAESYQADLQHLKEKVDKGADFVISQLFYDVDVFIRFVQDCRKVGIKCPIIPGIMPINTYHQFERMKRAFCKTKSESIDALSAKMQAMQKDDDEVKNFGVREVTAIIKKLMRKGVRGFHFYTQNLEKSVTRILTDPFPEGLGLLDDAANDTGLPCAAPNNQRDLPWLQSANMKRVCEEEVRPAFWSNRPKSYMAKTMSWDDFPNGRWGDSRSPAFGEEDHSHNHVSHAKQWLDAKSGPWSANATIANVCEIFYNALLNGDGPQLPWFERTLAPESDRILKGCLSPMNRHGMVTINSQPGVNGERSDTRDVGWGPAGGYVYQKAYVEFFCSPAVAAKVFEVITQPKYNQLTYMRANSSGDFTANQEGVNAVTWGVFPGKEIVQPTVVDTCSFMEWRKEAFALWLAPYKPGEERFCPPFIQEVYKTWWLIHIVDNDYVQDTQLDSAMAEVLKLVPEIIPEAAPRADHVDVEMKE